VSISEILDRVVRTRARFASIYFETSLRRVRDRQRPERATREWLAQEGPTLKYRREVRTVDPSGRTNGQINTITVSDGRHRWNESRLDEEIQVTKMPASGADPELVLLRGQIRAADASPLGSREIERHRCSGLEIRHPGSVARYWFSEQYGIQWKRERITNSGGTESAIVRTVTRVETDQPVAPDVFTYTPPEGVEVHASAAESMPED
jgi:hypothetical protein